MSTDSSTGIQSAEIALDVLTRLAELGGAQSVSELGRSLDMPRAKVHRYLVSLERRGYVEQDPASARYRLGPQALHTGLAALAEVDFVKLAADGLDALSGAIGQTVFISIWGQHGPTIVQWRDARLPVTVNVRVGSVLPCSTTPPAGSMPPGCRGPGPAPRPGRMGRAAAPGRRRVLAAGRGQAAGRSRRGPARALARHARTRLRHGQRPSAARHRFGQRAGAGRPGRPGGRAHQPGAARRLRPVARRRPGARAAGRRRRLLAPAGLAGLRDGRDQRLRPTRLTGGPAADTARRPACLYNSELPQACPVRPAGLPGRFHDERPRRQPAPPALSCQMPA